MLGIYQPEDGGKYQPGDGHRFWERTSKFENERTMGKRSFRDININDRSLKTKKGTIYNCSIDLCCYAFINYF